jgi:hydroxyacylglutathione hydrolase
MINLIATLNLGELSTNCYILSIESSSSVIVVDPAEAKPVLDFCSKNNWKISYVLFTHGHYDHILGAMEIKKATNASIICGLLEKEMIKDPILNGSQVVGNSDYSVECDNYLNDGEEFFGLKVLYTPGHTKGGISLVGQGFVLTGDTLFAGSIGRSDLPGGDYKKLINSIKNVLFTLPDSYIIYPGHGQQSTIGFEKKNNPYLVGI